MGLKILHSADWHLDSPLQGFRPEQQAYLKRELRKVPGKIADLCIRENCDLMLLSGDLFDGPCTRESAELVSAALERCGVPVFIAPGNHDFLSPGSPWLEQIWPDNVHIFSPGLSSVSLEELDCRIYGSGYRGMECEGLLEGFRAEGPERYRLAVLHGDPLRLHSPYCPVTAAQVRDSGLDYLALGHIHKSGSFRARGTLCGWPGTPMGRGFDETREKGIYIIEIDDSTTLRQVWLDTPRFFDLELDTDEADPDRILPAAEDAHFYRITLLGSGEESLRDLKTRYASFPNLEFIDRRQKPSDPWARAGADSLEGLYFRILRDKLESAPEEEKAAVALAAEISRKILDGREVIL